VDSARFRTLDSGFGYIGLKFGIVWQNTLRKCYINYTLVDMGEGGSLETAFERAHISD